MSEAAMGPGRTPADKRASIAVDLGAESCRVSLLRWIEDAPETTLVHRFLNSPVQHDGTLRWPLAAIEAGVDQGMRMCAELAPEGIRSVAVDGWAVDYVRVDGEGKPLGEPFCYRDERTEAAEEKLHQTITPARLREITGIQQFRINTLYQLYADQLGELPSGVRWLNLPEYMLARWGGEPVSEYTNATHTQLVDLRTGEWSKEIFAAAGLDLRHAPRIVPPGTRLGKLRGPLSELAAFSDTELIAPACHDTASALAGIPGLGEDWAYISSGTWSLVGALTPRALNDAEVSLDNFTNLGAASGATCFHKNVNGMWLLKQAIDTWAADGTAEGTAWTLPELIARAETLGVPDVLLDVDDPELLLVGDMPARINAQLARRGQPAIDPSAANAPQVVALILHSLAARYAEVLRRVQHHTGKSLERIFIVGGGSRNGFLNRLTAKATGLKVFCGPVESSTIGNFAVQLAALERDALERAGFAEDVAAWAGTLHPLDAEAICP